MLLAEAVTVFIDDVAGWKRNETPKTYAAKLRRLTNCHPDETIDRITLTELNSLKRSLLENLSPYTVKTVLTTIKHFFKWAKEKGLIEANPAIGMNIPVPPPPQPKAITPDTFNALMEVALTHGDPWETTRNVAILLWLRDTGGRSCGLISALVNNLDLIHGRCSVTEKDRQRILYLNDPTIVAMRSWMIERADLFPSTEHIFISHKTHAGLTRPGLRHIINMLAGEGGITSRHNPHSFRHAFARDCLQNGADLSQVSQLMGHSTVAITAAYYARWADSELKEIHSRASPVQ